MKKIAIMLIMGGIFLVLSMDATAGITYPRNQMSILETRLNAHPWDDPFTSSTGVRVSTISRPADIKTDLDSQSVIRNIRYAGPLFIRVVLTYWKFIISDYGTNCEPITIIKD